ncbi:MAG: type VI secretion system protein TssA [Rhizobacter sp.]|nr:type VI secretion system protein TssA [Rhizobacter sp.]
MTALPVEELLAPLGDTAPCGDDLEYDPAFVALEVASRGKPEQQFGDKVIPAEEPDWRGVHEQALALARRTRDLRVAVLLARSGARVHGIAAYADGLALIAGLLERHWPHVYPLLDTDDGDDSTMRMNALAPLADAGSGVNDLRHASVGAGRTAITVRQIELAFGKIDPRADEAAPSPEGVLQALRSHEAQTPGLIAALQQVGAQIAAIESTLGDKVGGAAGPDMGALRALARILSTAATQAGGAEAAGAEVPEGAPPGQVAAPGSMNSREDVIRTLDRVCDWIERHEPTNPAPLLIRRAQRLMHKNFMEIIRDLVPDGIDQVEKIAGASGE